MVPYHGRRCLMALGHNIQSIMIGGKGPLGHVFDQANVHF